MNTPPRHHSHTRSLLTTAAVAIPAMLIGAGLSLPSAQAGYVVDLTQQGSNVVATGSGTIDTTDLTKIAFTFILKDVFGMQPIGGLITTGPTSSELQSEDGYYGFTGPTSFGTGGLISLSSGSGDLVSMDAGGVPETLFVPHGYVSGSTLSSSATWDNATFSSLGVTPGTYTWSWGNGADADSFTLQIGPAAVPAPLIDRGLPVLLAVGGLLFGAKLLERCKRRRLQLG